MPGNLILVLALHPAHCDSINDTVVAAASAFGLLATPAQAGCHRHKHQHAEWYEREWNNDEYQPQEYDQSQQYYQSQPYYQQTECYRPAYYYSAPVCQFDEEWEDD
jgi:hypothetical protein